MIFQGRRRFIMGVLNVDIFIERPPDEVFSYLCDYANQKVWQGQNVIELAVEPPGPAKVGTQVHKVRQTPGGKQRFTMEVTEMDVSARRWTEDTLTGSLRGTKAVWQVQPDGKGSQVKHTIEFRAVGFSKLLLPLITSTARKDFSSEFANLKQILETKK
jgi:hypothetical protein